MFETTAWQKSLNSSTRGISTVKKKKRNRDGVYIINYLLIQLDFKHSSIDAQ